MRVIDLLALMRDYNRTTKVALRTANGPATLDHIQLAEDKEQPQLILIPKAGGKPLQLWEFAVLLDQKDRRLRYLYIQEADGPRPVFGFQVVKGILEVN